VANDDVIIYAYEIYSGDQLITFVYGDDAPEGPSKELAEKRFETLKESSSYKDLRLNVKMITKSKSPTSSA